MAMVLHSTFTFLALLFFLYSFSLVYPSHQKVVLGFTYAFANSLVWCKITEILGTTHREQANGLFAGSINFLPSIVPSILLVRG